MIVTKLGPFKEALWYIIERLKGGLRWTMGSSRSFMINKFIEIFENQWKSFRIDQKQLKLFKSITILYNNLQLFYIFTINLDVCSIICSHSTCFVNNRVHIHVRWIKFSNTSNTIIWFLMFLLVTSNYFVILSHKTLIWNEHVNTYNEIIVFC